MSPFAVVSVATLLTLPSMCQHTASLPAPAGATFCQIASPILWDPKDTRQTKEQVDTYNRKGKQLCGWGVKK